MYIVHLHPNDKKENEKVISVIDRAYTLMLDKYEHLSYFRRVRKEELLIHNDLTDTAYLLSLGIFSCNISSNPINSSYHKWNIPALAPEAILKVDLYKIINNYRKKFFRAVIEEQPRLTSTTKYYPKGFNETVIVFSPTTRNIISYRRQGETFICPTDFPLISTNNLPYR